MYTRLYRCFHSYLCQLFVLVRRSSARRLIRDSRCDEGTKCTAELEGRASRQSYKGGKDGHSHWRRYQTRATTFGSVATLTSIAFRLPTLRHILKSFPESQQSQNGALRFLLDIPLQRHHLRHLQPSRRSPPRTLHWCRDPMESKLYSQRTSVGLGWRRAAVRWACYYELFRHVAEDTEA